MLCLTNSLVWFGFVFTVGLEGHTFTETTEVCCQGTVSVARGDVLAMLLSLVPGLLVK